VGNLHLLKGGGTRGIRSRGRSDVGKGRNKRKKHWAERRIRWGSRRELGTVRVTRKRRFGGRVPFFRGERRGRAVEQREVRSSIKNCCKGKEKEKKKALQKKWG